MKLTDSIIKAAKPRDKHYNLPDGKGLTLWVQPDGQKAWRMRYYLNDKERCYPLASIRWCRWQRQGRSMPVSRNCWKHDKTERHADYTIRRMEADIFPVIGHKPVNEITAAQFIVMTRKVESRGAYTTPESPSLFLYIDNFRFFAFDEQIENLFEFTYTTKRGRNTALRRQVGSVASHPSRIR